MDVFKSLREVERHLRQLGYRVSKSKLSRDASAGLIKVNPDKSISKGQIIKYSASLPKDEKVSEDVSDVALKIKAAELDSLTLKIERQQLDLDKEKGKYILRSDFERELAARAVVFESGFRHMFNVQASEWIAMVGGKVEKTADFLQSLNTGLDEQLNRYASVQAFQVIFEPDNQSS